PVRVELFGDLVEETRFFRVADQRSLGPAPGLWAPPCRELLLTPDVRDRAKHLANDHPGLAEVLGKLADGISVEGHGGARPCARPTNGAAAQLRARQWCGARLRPRAD